MGGNQILNLNLTVILSITPILTVTLTLVSTLILTLGHDIWWVWERSE